MKSALLVLAAVLLAVPGAFVCAKGVAALRRRQIRVHGQAVRGSPARAAGGALVLYGLAMITLAAVLVAATVGR